MEHCKYEKEIGYMKATMEAIKESVDEIKNNDLVHIYEKLSSPRPSLTVTIIITFLTSLVSILLTIQFK